ncbi:MAG: DNA polymerase III subunit [Verrucomicrobia bacterium]|nr:DNA polymerase III subunit [Verrucomicrobiota bacterium]
MAFKDFPEQQQGVKLLQRSLERGRLAHAYLFTGHHLDLLEGLTRTLAKTLNCLQPLMQAGLAIDCCDRCLSCQKIEHGNHADVFWVRPESKSRVIKIGQIVHRDDSPPRVLLDAVNLKPTESRYKIGVIVAADRMHDSAANAFLKTLEEPPRQSVLILLTTEPQRLLETILSRCLRLNFAAEGPRQLAPAQLEWLTEFSEMAARDQKSLLGRYRLMDVLLRKLNAVRTNIEETLAARSPLEKYEDAEDKLRDKWEEELKAAVEAEYRRQRADFLLALHWWLRDVWLLTLGEVQGLESNLQSPEPEVGASAAGSDPINHQLSIIDSPTSLLAFPQLAGANRVAQRISPKAAMENLRIMEQLQRWLGTNAQEALALEVGLLRLQL